MWTVIENEDVVREAQGVLYTALTNAASPAVSCRAGYQGGNLDVDAHWLGRYGIWFAHLKLKDEPVPRFWNAFGTTRPTPRTMMSIVCEINLPLHGIDRRVAGAIARDETGGMHVVHRGRIGGGRTGIGQENDLWLRLPTEPICFAQGGSGIRR